MNGIWHIMWRNLSKPVRIIGHYSIPSGCPFNTDFTRGDSAYERGGDARRKFWIKPLKKTDLGVAQAFFYPLKETMLKLRQ